MSVMSRLLADAFTPFQELYEGMMVATPASTAPMYGSM
jgi:hypothetical protein